MKRVLIIIIVSGCFLFSINGIGQTTVRAAQTLAEIIAKCDPNFANKYPIENNFYELDNNISRVIHNYCILEAKFDSRAINRCKKNDFYNHSAIKIHQKSKDDLTFGFYVNTIIDLSELSKDEASKLDFTGSIFHNVTIVPPAGYHNVTSNGFKTNSKDVCSCNVSIQPELNKTPHEFNISGKDKKCTNNESKNPVERAVNYLKSLVSDPGSTNPAPATAQ